VRKNYKVTPRAQSDLRSILRRIGQENLSAGEHMRELFYHAFFNLGETPYMGQKRDDLTSKPVRFWPAHRNYMVIYDPKTNPVEILRVYHVARHIASILPEGSENP